MCISMHLFLMTPAKYGNQMQKSLCGQAVETVDVPKESVGRTVNF